MRTKERRQVNLTRLENDKNLRIVETAEAMGVSTMTVRRDLQRLAEQGITVLEEIMASGEDKDRIKAVELAARLGNLDPLVQAKMKQENVAVNTGVQLVVNFGNGLKVPDAFKGGNVVIETTAEAVDEVE